MQMRPALSNATCTDSLPMNRFSTTLFGSLLGIASIEIINFSISSGGNTRRQGPSFSLGQSINVISVPSFAGRHIDGIWTRRFSSTPCRYSEL
jgi:hypothetical protein